MKIFNKSVFFVLLLFFCILLSKQGFARQQVPDTVYMFSYFKGNGGDGLHLAYSFDGYNWKALNNDKSVLQPTVGGDKLMRDPNILKGPDGTFHMVWTVSWHEKGIGYASSPDLIHWSKQQFIPVMKDEPEARNCWAPELFYDQKAKRYLIFWATTIPGRFPETDDTGDHHLNHRIYYTDTKDFQDYSDTKLFFNPGFNVIDATIKKNGSQYVMFFKDERRHPEMKNVHLVFSNSASGPYDQVSQSITGNYWAEGPTVLKKGGQWMVYFDKYRKHTMGAVKSTDLEHWQDISYQIHFPKGTRHGSVFKVTKQQYQKLKNALN